VNVIRDFGRSTADEFQQGIGQQIHGGRG
jgi:hypothetical protein